MAHPFPSVLDGLVVAAVALIAGADPGRAAGLGASMTLLQLGIGATNDVVDAPADAGLKPGKPIPAGLVPSAAARGLALACFGGGVALAFLHAPAVGALAVVVIGIGLAYDLALKGSAWSWLPFAVGIPILPVYGWLGARGDLHPAFAIVVPVAVLAGAALAIANGLVDVERDLAAGRTSVAARLGRRPAASLAIALLIGVLVADAFSIARAEGAAWAGAVSLGGAITALGAAIAAWRRPDLSERAWQAEAVALGATAVGWIAAVLA